MLKVARSQRTTKAGEPHFVPEYVEAVKPENTEILSYGRDTLELIQELQTLLMDPGSRVRAILFGLPGFGKTATIRNLAHATLRPFWFVKADKLFSSFLGGTASNLTALFQAANKAAAVIVFDDFDAFARNREDPRESGESRRLVSVLLSELDQPSNICSVLAATNIPRAIDPAVLRRFSVIIPFDTLDYRTTQNLLCDITGLAEPPKTLVRLAMRVAPSEVVDAVRRLDPRKTDFEQLTIVLARRVNAIARMRK